MTVPGAVAGWEALRSRFGKLPMSDLLAPAIFYAEDGFPGHRRHRRRVGAARSTSSPPSPTPRRPILIERPRAQSRRGLQEPRSGGVAAPDRGARARPASTKGKTAEAILAVSREKGGTMTAADLKEFTARVGRSDLDDVSRLDGVTSCRRTRRASRR